MATVVHLDTHVIVWLYAGRDDLLSDKGRRAIRDDQLVFSPIVRLELQYLLETERITKKPNQILDTLGAEIALRPCHSNFEAVVSQASGLKWTRDPFDRIITAQAGVAQARLLTKDQTIRKHYRKAFWD